ncbi:MAG: methionine--tRNA ligase, partial [Myxococcota bacterium]|nr:methionine--tRNA ligase [Myxococcota bacterium]
ERFYVTTPIYYVNGKPHIGTAYTTVLADTIRRYHRLFGEETYLLTGTDEHGQKVQDAAAERGLTPLAHCDELQLAFREMWPKLHIEVDQFIRTTEPRHKDVVQRALSSLYEAGDIYAQDYEGWYSTSVERFWTEKDLVDGCCPESGEPVQRIREKNYFFRMSRYGEQLRQHINENPDFLLPAHRANEVLGFLDKGLEDLCISRPKTRLSWGIEIPFDEDYVTYVWFDALLNYISALEYGEGEMFDRWWPQSHHLIGKDILTTHAVYWTTMLLAMGLPLPRTIVAHGWWLQNESKMAKSVGNTVSPLDMKDVYGADVFRYYLMRDMVVGLDAEFSEAGLIRRNNSDLANDLGNLARRAGGLVDRYFEGRVPAPVRQPGDDEKPVLEMAEQLLEGLPGILAEFKIHSAIEETLQFVRRLNKYMTDTAPFKSVKTDPDAAALSLYTVLEGLRHAAVLLYPVMPERMGVLLRGLSLEGDNPSALGLSWGGLETGVALDLKTGLFPRAEAVEAPDEPAPKAAAGKPAPPDKSPKSGSESDEGSDISFDEFMRVDLRVATVLACERVEGADRLLKFEVDLGEERRQVVSGIAQHFEPDSLVGRQVVMVVNLAPRKIFKIMSQGMLLTAEAEDGQLKLLGPDAAVPPGTRIA